MERYALTIPLGLPFPEQRRVIKRLPELGYTDVWTGEVSAWDAFTPLAFASEWAPSLRLGTAVASAFSRGPAIMAQSAASMAVAAPGRFALGVGASSDVITERWNAQPFERPFSRTRDLVRFLKAAFTGEKVVEKYDTFEINGFRLGLVPEQPPPVLVAALRERMLHLGGTEADGVILNWLSATDVAKVAPLVHEGRNDKEIVCRIFVSPSGDSEQSRQKAREFINAYLNVGVYADYQRWLGRGDALAPMQAKWASGDRRGALAEVPEEVVSDLIVLGTPDECRAHIQRYVDNGVTTPMLAIMPFGIDLEEAIELLAPQPTAVVR
jgi:probable F420-dependent oxidoreductase